MYKAPQAQGAARGPVPVLKSLVQPETSCSRRNTGIPQPPWEVPSSLTLAYRLASSSLSLASYSLEGGYSGRLLGSHGRGSVVKNCTQGKEQRPAAVARREGVGLCHTGERFPPRTSEPSSPKPLDINEKTAHCSGQRLVCD